MVVQKMAHRRKILAGNTCLQWLKSIVYYKNPVDDFFLCVSPTHSEREGEREKVNFLSNSFNIDPRWIAFHFPSFKSRASYGGACACVREKIRKDRKDRFSRQTTTGDLNEGQKSRFFSCLFPQCLDGRKTKIGCGRHWPMSSQWWMGSRWDNERQMRKKIQV